LIAVMVGPHAQQVLKEAGVAICEPNLPSGQQVVDDLRSGRLQAWTKVKHRF
jgi:predicted Fe-Mo cluster-binding NifX family protein